jgi:glycosyltransferase involved in cell wall biosynthesis
MPAPVLPLRPVRSGRRRGRTYGLLSTFSPTPCGIATFSASLAVELAKHPGSSVGVVRIGAVDGEQRNPLVVAELANGDPTSVRNTIDALNRFDVAIVQHEYGIYGGPDGDEILDVLRGLVVPSMVVAHTVVEKPTANQRRVLHEIAGLASAIVVMTDAARHRLCDLYGVDPVQVETIPHGAAVGNGVATTVPERPTILTWGLIGPGKGIEWMIDALSELDELQPRPRYVVAGRTHPKVLASGGESYREMLMQRAWASGVAPWVSFDPAYRDNESLGALIRRADVVVLPYDSHDQATSGVLVDAIAAGRPVIATAFPHAVELLSGGAGIVVPHGDALALAAALRRVFTEPGLASNMARSARGLAADLAWPAVAVQYAALSDHVLGSARMAV